MRTITLSSLKEHLNQNISVKVIHSVSQVGLSAVTTYKITKGTLVDVVIDKKNSQKSSVTLNVKGKKITFSFGKIIEITAAP